MKRLTEREKSFLKIVFAATLFLTFINILSKLIGGYNQAIEEAQLNLVSQANNSISFGFYSFYKFYNHSAFFTLFSIFIFLVSLAFKKHTNTNYFSVISFFFLSLSLLNATFLPIWFAEIASIEFSPVMLQFNFFDGLLYICFAIIVTFYLKIIYRFTRENFQARISLR